MRPWAMLICLWAPLAFAHLVQPKCRERLVDAWPLGGAVVVSLHGDGDALAP